jgi:hypothetical protein
MGLGWATGSLTCSLTEKVTWDLEQDKASLLLRFCILRELGNDEVLGLSLANAAFPQLLIGPPPCMGE